MTIISHHIIQGSFLFVDKVKGEQVLLRAELPAKLFDVHEFVAGGVPFILSSQRIQLFHNELSQSKCTPIECISVYFVSMPR